MAGSSLKHSAPLVLALLIITDPLLTTGATGETDIASTDMTTVTTVAGGTAVMRCPLRGGYNDIRWSHQPDHEKMKNRRPYYFYSSNIHCTEDDESCMLMFKDVQKTRTGFYSCEDYNNPSLKHTFYLSVVDPTVTILGEPSRVHLQGSAINLTCEAKPQREPENFLLWMHNHLLINSKHNSRFTIIKETNTSTTSHLLIEDAQPEDSGNYICKLFGGSSDSVEVNVIQDFPEDIDPAMSGSQRPLAAVPAAGLLALAVAAAAFSSHCR